MSVVESTNTNHSLQNIDNYKYEFTNSSTEIFSKYIGIVTEYFINCSESINIQNERYYKYVIHKVCKRYHMYLGCCFYIQRM